MHDVPGHMFIFVHTCLYFIDFYTPYLFPVANNTITTKPAVPHILNTAKSKLLRVQG